MLTEQVINGTIKGLTRLVCRVHDAELAKVPQKGPLIIVSNHINSLEVPLMYTHLWPRPMRGFAKAETWDNPIFGSLFTMWNAIPVRRGEGDVEAIRQGLAVLDAGQMLIIAPEGTRSYDGRLQRGHPGVVIMALRSGAPILPVAYYGNERLRDNLSRLRRTDFRIHVGKAFTLHRAGQRVTRAIRQQMVDEIMFQLAALLPPAYRGLYADLSAVTKKYLRFSEGG